MNTGVVACKAIKDQDPYAFAKMLVQFGERALLLGAALSMIEKDPARLAKQAIGGSAAITAYLITWNNLTDCEPLPSGDAAYAWLDKKPGGLTALLSSMVIRAGMVATGISWAGEKEPAALIKKSLLAVTAIEATVLWEATHTKREDVESGAGL